MKFFKRQILFILILLSNVVHGEKNNHITTEVALIEIHDSIFAAIEKCTFSDKLELTDVFAACDKLHALRVSSEVMLNESDIEIVSAIIQLINERLMRNQAFVLFLKNLDASVEQRQRITNNEFVMIMKNSPLLVSIDEVHSFAQIVAAVQGISDTVITVNRLNRLLEDLELDISKTILDVWTRGDFWTSFYTLQEYNATEKSEQIVYKKKSAHIKKTVDTIITALGITDEYAATLRRFQFLSCTGKDNLYEFFEDAYSGETSSVSLANYARYIEKCVRQNERLFSRHVDFSGESG